MPMPLAVPGCTMMPVSPNVQITPLPTAAPSVAYRSTWPTVASAVWPAKPVASGGGPSV